MVKFFGLWLVIEIEEHKQTTQTEVFIMSRNTKPEYINRIRKTEAPNGYKFDIANYLYNPSYDHDYPSFIKVIAEDEHTRTYRRYYYFKHYNGTGEYLTRLETYKDKDGGSGWSFTTPKDETILAHDNRFNLKRLLSFIA